MAIAKMLGVAAGHCQCSKPAACSLKQLEQVLCALTARLEPNACIIFRMSPKGVYTAKFPHAQRRLTLFFFVLLLLLLLLLLACRWLYRC
jgi:hypothetical protein